MTTTFDRIGPPTNYNASEGDLWQLQTEAKYTNGVWVPQNTTAGGGGGVGTSVAAPTGVAATDTANVQAALTLANTNGSAAIQLQAGTYVCNTLTYYSNTYLNGAGRGITIIQLANGQNSDLLISNGFAGLVGTNGTGGVVNVTIANLTLDGNKANNTAGGSGDTTSAVLKKYGNAMGLSNVEIRNGAGRGCYTEWSTSSIVGNTWDEYNNLWIWNHAGDWQWNFNGPHDTLCTNLMCWANSLTPGQTVVGGILARQTVHLNTFHVWGYLWRCVVTEGSCILGNFQIEEGLTCLELTGNNNVVAGGHIYNDSQSGATGIQVGSSIFAGSAAHNVVSGVLIDSQDFGSVVFANDGGANYVEASVTQTTGDVYGGSPPGTGTTRLIRLTGGATATGAPLNWTAGDTGFGNAVVLTPAATVSVDPTAGNIFTLVPARLETINAASVIAGQTITIVVTTSGASSFVLTFGTNFKSTGTLATGTSTGKVFTITFVGDGTNYNETSRTTAM